MEKKKKKNTFLDHLLTVTSFEKFGIIKGSVPKFILFTAEVPWMFVLPTQSHVLPVYLYALTI
jgi:hypothetical protein